MDMRFYWIKDRVQQKQFIIYWAPGAENLADYFTKHHPASHHRQIRSTYLKPAPEDSKEAQRTMMGVPRGCVNYLQMASNYVSTPGGVRTEHAPPLSQKRRNPNANQVVNSYY